MTGESSTNMDKFRGNMKLLVRLSKDSKESYCMMFMETCISLIQVNRWVGKVKN